MCLRTTDPTIHVAEQDIVVYKSLRFSKEKVRRKGILGFLGMKTAIEKAYATSYSSGFEYQQGVQQPLVELIPRKGYSDYKVEEGYHSDATFSVGQSNAVFIIPKGSKYILGNYNGDSWRINYVSETIIFKEKIINN